MAYLNENRVGFGREATLLADAADAAPDLHDLYEPALDGAFADAAGRDGMPPRVRGRGRGREQAMMARAGVGQGWNSPLYNGPYIHLLTLQGGD